MDWQERRNMQQTREALQRRTDEAGSLADLKTTLEGGVAILDDQDKRCEEQKEGLRLVFQKRLEQWLTTPVPATQPPITLPEDRRTARCYRGAAYACVVFEALLGAAILASFMNLQWWSAILVGGVVAVLAAIIFESSILLMFRQVDRPKQMLNDIRRWFLLPSFVLFVISLLFWLAARAAQGNVASLLEPAMQVVLWVTTVGLLFLGAALLASAFIVSWSDKIRREYRSVESEQVAAKVLRGDFNARLKAFEPHTPRLLLASRANGSNKDQRYETAEN